MSPRWRPRVPLHVGELLVGGGELFRELGVSGSVDRQRVEMVGRALQQEGPGGGGAGQRLDLLVHLEDQSVGEPTGVFEALLGAKPVGLGETGLAGGGEEAQAQGDQEQGRPHGQRRWARTKRPRR